MPNFITEMKRRNVFRVAVAYTVVAWVIAQAFDLAADSFAAPDWVMKVALTVLVAGLPVAIILAWAFELTPDGVKKTADVPETDSITPRTGRRINYVITTALVLALAFIAWDKFGPSEVTVESAVTDKSVAVLPFADLSELQDQEWFADGLTEEILNSLARLPELQVTARTSSFEFKNTNTDIGDIARKLGVAHVVEGSVRRIGDKLRVTAQLIRAQDGFHLWSETYDSNTEALFDVQHDVAENIAASLDIILDEDKRSRMFSLGTRNVAAFEAYAKGRKLFGLAHTRGSSTLVTLADANVFLAKAMELDPGFALPAILHADQYAHVLIEPGALIVGDTSGLDEDSAYELLMQDLNFAVDNAPDAASRVVAELNREYFAPHWHRMPGLLEELRDIVDSGVPLPESVVWLQELLLLNQELEMAEELSKRRQLSDPLNSGGWQDEADIRLQQRDFERAEKLFDYARSKFGNTPALIERQIYSALLQGDKATVLALLQNDVDYSGDYFYYEPLLAALQGDHELALQIIEKQQKGSARYEIGLLMTYLELGDADLVRSLVSRVDAMKVGPTMLAIDLTARGRIIQFDLNDTPRLKKRLDEAGIDPASFAR
jgi:TolB-like protein/ketosteroid isomerase-like protein